MEALKDFILKFNHPRTVSRSHVIGEHLLFLNQMGLQNLQIKARLDKCGELFQGGNRNCVDTG